jgi:hypothetical protein
MGKGRSTPATQEDYIAQLQDLDQWIREQVSTIPEERRLIATNHREFRVLLPTAMAFTIIATIVPSVSTQCVTVCPAAGAPDRPYSPGQGDCHFPGDEGTNPQLAQQVSADSRYPVVSGPVHPLDLGSGGRCADLTIDMM